MSRQRFQLQAERRLAALMVLVILVAGACVKPPPSGVSVKSLAADLVFGIPAQPESASPPNLDLTPEDPVGVISFNERPRFDRPIQQPPPQPDCPEAGSDAFPAAVAEPDVVGEVKEGSYRWVADVQQQVSGIGTTTDRLIKDRLVQNKERTAATLTQPERAVTFQMVDYDLVFGSQRTITTRYEIRSNGIYLVSRRSQEGNRPPTEFTPIPALLLMGLPVKIGNQVDSTGVDPNSQEVEQIRGFVSKRLRVDACGELVDSWLVESDRTFTPARGGQQQTSKYDYAFATQLGGLLVFEHFEVPKANPRLKADARIGQLEPGPLPKR